jgi:hypothetical protein
MQRHHTKGESTHNFKVYYDSLFTKGDFSMSWGQYKISFFSRHHYITKRKSNQWTLMYQPKYRVLNIDDRNKIIFAVNTNA